MSVPHLVLSFSQLSMVPKEGDRVLVMVWAEGARGPGHKHPLSSALLLRMKGRTVHPLPNTRRCMDQIPSWDSWGCHSLLVPLQGGAWQEDSGKGRAKEEASPRTMLLPPSAWGPVSPFLGQSRSARYLPMSKMLLISPHQSPPAFPCWASIFGRKTLHCFSCPHQLPRCPVPRVAPPLLYPQHRGERACVCEHGGLARLFLVLCLFSAASP